MQVKKKTALNSVELIERSLNATSFLFDFGLESGMERPQIIIVGFGNSIVNEQGNDSSVFNITDVTECFCTSRSNLHSEDRMNIYYKFNDYNEAYKEFMNVSFN